MLVFRSFLILMPLDSSKIVGSVNQAQDSPFGHRISHGADPQNEFIAREK